MCSENTCIAPVLSCKELDPQSVLNLLAKDLKDVDELAGLSKEDKRFTSNRRQIENGRYKVPMPFKESLPALECNIDLAEKRQYLRRKMEKNSA